MKLYEMFSDGQYLSWTRIMATPLIFAGAFSFIWSLIERYDSGLMYSIALITLALGTKSYQNYTETKIQNKIITEINEEK